MRTYRPGLLISLTTVFIIIAVFATLITIFYYFTPIKSMLRIPTHNKKYHIYDVLQNDNRELIVVLPAENTPSLEIQYIPRSKINNNPVTMELIECPQNHTHIYKCPMETYHPNITLLINNETVNTRCNKYPEFRDEIIVSLIVKDEDKYIRQFIDYYKTIGVTRFIIYDNSTSGTLSTLLQSYIHEGTVLLIEWNYPYNLPRSGNSGQITHENHSIYAFQNSKYIGFFDVDEYVNMRSHNTIDDMLNDVIRENKLSVEKDIACFVLSCKIFRNIHNQPTEGLQFFDVYDCGDVLDRTREKSFVVPKNTDMFSVHVTIQSVKRNFYIDPNVAYFNHYVFLNKENNRMPEYEMTFVDNTIKRIVDKIL